MDRPPFNTLYFGQSDARTEANANREEFVRSFVNLRDSLGSILSGEKFIILGPKGAGKSAIAWYLHSTQDSGQYRVLIRDAANLPLAEIPQLQTGQPAGAQRTVTAWRFILLCNYLELLLQDPDSRLHANPDAIAVSRALRDYGFIGDTSGKAILSASKATWSVPIPKIGTIYQRERTQTLNIFNVIPYLERWVSFTDRVVPLLFLDGLDSIFLNDSQYNESLSSLVQATYGLNISLREKGSNGTLALLLRNDVFSRIARHVPDSQKMRDDHGVQLDWRILSGAGPSTLSSPLIQLVSSKAAKALDVAYIDVLSYFPAEMYPSRPRGRRRRVKGIPVVKYLLNQTRHTPRDLLRLLESIRQVDAEQARPARGQLHGDIVREGVLRYSTEYFIGAIENEFAGFNTSSLDISEGLRALQHLQKTDFDREDFRAALREERGEASLDYANQLLRHLFVAGALGNLVRRPNGSYMNFYHRKDVIDVHLGGRFVLANPLAHAWNVPFSHSD